MQLINHLTTTSSPALTGDTVRSIRVHEEGSYFCRVTAANNCPGSSDTVHVDVVPLPDRPVIVRNGDMLTTAAATHYRWYRDGSPVEDSDNQFLAVTETGEYRVLITDENGCSAWSDVFVVDVLAVREDPVAVESFDLYPDPATDRLDVVLQLRQPEALQLMVFDMLGRSLLRRGFEAAEAHRVSVDLHGWRQGLYFLRVLTGSRTLTRSFRVQQDVP
ncbi:MAG: T9SS type A sorting domain-containing protein [Bacteroidota bacterium]|nr:T9SS type A sorting domain-containing protein [Bacteroidota bacterium]